MSNYRVTCENVLWAILKHANGLMRSPCMFMEMPVRDSTGISMTKRNKAVAEKRFSEKRELKVISKQV